MANKQLEGKKFVMPEPVRSELYNTLINWQGARDVVGYKRLRRLFDLETVSYDDLKNLIRAGRSEDIVKNMTKLVSWANDVLKRNRDIISKQKKTKSTLGFSNQYKNNNVSKRFNESKLFIIIPEKFIKKIYNELRLL